MIFLGFSDTIKVDMNNARRTEEKVFSFMEEHHMLKAGDRVITSGNINLAHEAPVKVLP